MSNKKEAPLTINLPFDIMSPEYADKSTRADLFNILSLIQSKSSGEYPIEICPHFNTDEVCIDNIVKVGFLLNKATDISELCLRIKEYSRDPYQYPHYEYFHQKYMSPAKFNVLSFDGDPEKPADEMLNQYWYEIIDAVNYSNKPIQEILYMCKWDDINPFTIDRIETVDGDSIVILFKNTTPLNTEVVTLSVSFNLDSKTVNDNIYPTEVMKAVIQDLRIKSLIKNRTLFGQVNPDYSNIDRKTMLLINLTQSSFLIKNLSIEITCDGSILKAEIECLDNPLGRELAASIKSGERYSLIPRGISTLVYSNKDDAFIVQPDYKLAGLDLVSQPVQKSDTILVEFKCL